MDKGIPQFELPDGARVVMKDYKNDYIEIKFKHMKGSYGVWLVGVSTLKGNYYGTFHYYEELNHYLYKPEKEDWSRREEQEDMYGYSGAFFAVSDDKDK